MREVRIVRTEDTGRIVQVLDTFSADVQCRKVKLSREDLEVLDRESEPAGVYVIAWVLAR